MKSVKITNFDFNGSKPLETANEIPTEITDLNGLSFSGFVKGDIDNPYDLWQLNDDVDTSKGIAIGYFNNNNLTFVFAQKERAGIQVTNGVDTSGVTVEADEVSITSPTITIVGDATLNGETLTAVKVVKNIEVDNWVSDSTYAGYDYKAILLIDGVTTNDVVQALFSADDVISGNYLSVVEVFNGGIYIYAMTDNTITIPAIIIHKGA